MSDNGIENTHITPNTHFTQTKLFCKLPHQKVDYVRPPTRKVPSRMSTAKPKKKSIPKVVKDLSWNKWIGDDIAKAKCLCCNVNEIKMSSFHCGHVIAEANGGSTTVDNLRPICSACNLSMRTENMNTFKNKCGFDKKVESKAKSKPEPKVIKGSKD
jgi:hypothetical protein